MMELTVPQILRKAAEKAGLKRVRHIDKNCPTNIQNCCVVLAYGDLRSTCVLSSLLLKRYKEEARSSKYFILCTWPGYENLFPWVDEFWTLNDESQMKSIYNQARGLKNDSEAVKHQQRVLHTFFEDVVEGRFFEKYYDRGLQSVFFDRFKDPVVWMPEIPSSMILGTEINRRLNQFSSQVYVSPVTHIQMWRFGKLEPYFISKEFWKSLLERLLKENMFPVVHQNQMTYDLSPDYADRCLFLNNTDIGHTLSIMRSTGCVLDIYSGLSRLSCLARTPSVALEDRNVYFEHKDYEIEDLCGFEVPHNHVFSPAIVCEEVNRLHWNSLLFDGIVSKIKSVLSIDKNLLPSPVEMQETVSYARVRELKAKKFGTRFIKIKD